MNLDTVRAVLQEFNFKITREYLHPYDGDTVLHGEMKNFAVDVWPYGEDTVVIHKVGDVTYYYECDTEFRLKEVLSKIL